MEKISVIVPCFNEEEVLPLFYDEMIRVAGVMDAFDFELLFVDDGSKDHTLQVIKDLAAKDDRVKYVSFSRNFGKEAAMYAGFTHAGGDYVVVMDADLQDPPALLPEMLPLLLQLQRQASRLSLLLSLSDSLPAEAPSEWVFSVQRRQRVFPDSLRQADRSVPASCSDSYSLKQ